MHKYLRFLPGWAGTGLVTILNAIWLYWGLGEAFYEGWGVPDTPWILFLSVGLGAMVFSVIAILFPYVGGGLLITVGAAFAVWWLIPGIKSGYYSFDVLIGRLFLSGGFALVGILFVWDGKLVKKSAEPGRNWLLRKVRLLIAVGIPVLAGLVVAVINLPIVLTRVDDGDRSARLIEGKGVALIWAPEGPGWNWKQKFGGYPSWDALAFYGVDPIGIDKEQETLGYASEKDMQTTGLCAYLSGDGTTLMSEPQNIWQMPTADEIAQSLSQDNENAGCTWDGVNDRLSCEIRPDKETPLWAPDEPPVYYWTANEKDAANAYYVSYTGWVGSQPKDWGNPRHGYRCVKEP